MTLGRSTRFGLGARPEERGRLIALLEDHLQTLRRSSAADLDAAATEIPHAPSDSEITVQQDRDRLVFVRTYPLPVGLIAVMTFMNLFCNGILANFVLQVVIHFSWVLWLPCLFLIPFVIIGVAMLALWLWVLAAPWRRREWVFQPNAITARVSVLGIGRTRTFDPLSLDRIELRKGVRSGVWLTHGWPPDEADDRSFALGVVDSGGWDAFVIGALTEGEARWMERELHTAIKDVRCGRTMLPRTQGPVYDRWIDGPA